MKKNFTSISLAVATLLTSAAPAAAQQRQVSDQDKAAIASAIIPEMLNQVKLISGIDFIALAKPNIENVVNSPLFGTQNLLKAATPTAISIQPDSMRMDLSKLEVIPGKDLSFVLKDVKITFGNYKEFTVVTVDGRAVNVSMPGQIVATVLSLPITLNIETGAKTGLLPFSSLKATVNFGALTDMVEQAGIEGTDLISMTESTPSAGAFSYNVTLGNCLRSILTKLDAENANLPDFKINVDMTKMQVDGTISASLKGLIANQIATEIPMGDAKVYMNAQTAMADSTILTSYTTDATSISINQYKKLATKVLPAQNGKGFTIEVADSTSTPTDKTWKAGSITSVVTTSDQVLDLTDIKSAIFKALLTDMMDITAGTKTPFTVNVTTKADLNGDGTYSADELEPVLYAEVKTTLGGDLQNAKSTMDLDLYSDANKTVKLMNINITIPMKGNLMTAVMNQNDGTGSTFKLGTLYIKSNAMEVVTSNEASPELEDVKVCSRNGGVYIENSDNSTYSIISMTGAVVGQGRITGSSEFIATPATNRGTVYGIIIKKGRGIKGYKFIAK